MGMLTIANRFFLEQGDCQDFRIEFTGRCYYLNKDLETVHEYMTMEIQRASNGDDIFSAQINTSVENFLKWNYGNNLSIEKTPRHVVVQDRDDLTNNAFSYRQSDLNSAFHEVKFIYGATAKPYEIDGFKLYISKEIGDEYRIEAVRRDFSVVKLKCTRPSSSGRSIEVEIPDLGLRDEIDSLIRYIY